MKQEEISLSKSEVYLNTLKRTIKDIYKSLVQWQWWINIFQKYFLIIAFAIAIIIALAFPLPGAYLNGEVELREWGIGVVVQVNIICMFFFTGLLFDTHEVVSILKKQWYCVLYGIIAIIFITSLSGFVIAEIPLQPFEYIIGMVVFVCQACSIGSAPPMVYQLKGNSSLSILLVLATTFLACLTAPILVKGIIENQGQSVEVEYGQTLKKIVISNVVPLISAKILRDYISPLRRFVDRYKKFVNMWVNFHLALIVWQSLSTSQPHILATSFGSNVLMFVIIIVVHVVFLIFNFTVCKFIFLKEPELKAIVITCSQKVLPSAVALIEFMPLTQDQRGLAVVPCVFFQIFQTVIDQYLVMWWCARMEKGKEPMNLSFTSLSKWSLSPSRKDRSNGKRNTTTQNNNNNNDTKYDEQGNVNNERRVTFNEESGNIQAEEPDQLRIIKVVTDDSQQNSQHQSHRDSIQEANKPTIVQLVNPKDTDNLIVNPFKVSTGNLKALNDTDRQTITDTDNQVLTESNTDKKISRDYSLSPITNVHGNALANQIETNQIEDQDIKINFRSHPDQQTDKSVYQITFDSNPNYHKSQEYELNKRVSVDDQSNYRKSHDNYVINHNNENKNSSIRQDINRNQFQKQDEANRNKSDLVKDGNIQESDSNQYQNGNSNSSIIFKNIPNHQNSNQQQSVLSVLDSNSEINVSSSSTKKSSGGWPKTFFKSQRNNKDQSKNNDQFTNIIDNNMYNKYSQQVKAKSWLQTPPKRNVSMASSREQNLVQDDNPVEHVKAQQNQNEKSNFTNLHQSPSTGSLPNRNQSNKAIKDSSHKIQPLANNTSMDSQLDDKLKSEVFQSQHTPKNATTKENSFRFHPTPDTSVSAQIP